MHSNRIQIFSAVISWLALTTGCDHSPTPPQPQAAVVEPVYSVNVYDPSRNPAEDLAATVQLVSEQPTPRRILLQVGGDWCGWCKRLDRFVVEDQDVAEMLHENYIIMKVNYSDENPNKEFLAQYPEVPGYPHLYVLEGDGTLLQSQGTAELESGESYSRDAVLEFLNLWKPMPTMPDAADGA
jgi:thiol:disulfide interchange protein